MTIDYTNHAYSLNEAYYVYGNYSRFIRPGYQFLAISGPQSLAAFNQQNTLAILRRTGRPAAAPSATSWRTSPQRAVLRTSTRYLPLSNWLARQRCALRGRLLLHLACELRYNIRHPGHLLHSRGYNGE